MSKKFKGFSLAELLISLLVISIVLSAAIPTLTKRAGGDREQIWRWVKQHHNSTYFGLGANQAVIIGSDTMPRKDADADALIRDEASDDQINTANAFFTQTGDKLVILKQSLQGKSTYLANSHISFYNVPNGGSSANVTYGGRIAVDKHNLAFGRGTLLSMQEVDDSSYQGNNTAVGHFALMSAHTGQKNVAFGEKSLSLNKAGSENTAVGYLAGNRLGNQDRADSKFSSGNTAIGTYSLQLNNTGISNTAVGSESLFTQSYGDYNTTVGYNTLGYLESGHGNTAIGSNACSDLKTGDYNICIGNAVYNGNTTDSYSLSIGSSNGGNTAHDYPLITGHTQKSTYDKELIVNSRKVLFKPFYGGSYPTFEFISTDGTGYEVGKGLSAEAIFNLKHNVVKMNFTAEDDKAIIGIFDPDTVAGSGSTKTVGLKDLSFNKAIKIDFPDPSKEIDASDLIRTSTSGQVGLVSDTHDIIINKMLRVESNTTAKPTTVPALDITQSGVSVFGKGSNNFFKVSLMNKNSSTPEFQIKDQLIELHAPNGINFYSKDNTTASLSVKADGDVEIPTGVSLIIKDLNINPNAYGDVKKTLDYLKSELDKKMDSPSDARLKNISGDSTAGLAEINKLEIKNYTYKNDKEKKPHVGVIAQHLQKVFPNSVFKGDDGYLRIRTEEIFYAMVNSIKELFAKIQDLTAKIVGLDKRITELEAQNKLLLEQNKAFEKRLERLEKQAEK